MPPHHYSSVIVSNVRVFYKILMQIIINKDWSMVEVMN